MSSAAQADERSSIPVTAAVIAVVLLFGFLGFAGARLVLGSKASSGERVRIPRFEGAVEAKPWKTRVFPAGGAVPKAQRQRFARQSRALVLIVTDVFDAVFTGASDPDEAIADHFSKQAARALPARRIGIPARAHQVRITRRAASIGLHAPSNRYASARVVLRMKGKTPTGRFKLTHRASLFLERRNAAWRVVGFDVVQEPLR